ncbi:jg18056 [Pararge aegeria aegeria]|uniref:Jg18056 protein n=1 Tax=Pararge aegeria aegeria TaxID=348720 RepID=A0A8S4RFB6_9NEOP|nr:jg18056 [Pararge aegeria aegeria]
MVGGEKHREECMHKSFSVLFSKACGVHQSALGQRGGLLIPHPIERGSMSYTWQRLWDRGVRRQEPFSKNYRKGLSSLPVILEREVTLANELVWPSKEAMLPAS